MLPWPDRPILCLLLLLVMFQNGCGYEECRSNKRFAKEPGICGKIYRTQQVKLKFQERAKVIITVILLISGIPLLLVFLTKQIKRFFKKVKKIFPKRFNR